MSLGRFRVRDLDRLNHASELLAALAASIQQTNVTGKGAMHQLAYEANQEILAVMAKPVAAFQRWHQRRGLSVPREGEGGEPSLP
jgi:hypothetical protein